MKHEKPEKNTKEYKYITIIVAPLIFFLESKMMMSLYRFFDWLNKIRSLQREENDDDGMA